MPAYHSAIEGDFQQIGNVPLLPLRSKVRGPAPQTDQEDIVDEAISLYRANCFFKNFEVLNNSDRLLIYCLLYIGECLTKMQKIDSAGEATKQMITLSTGGVYVNMLPSDASFPLSVMYEKPATKSEQDTLRTYLGQIRQEIGQRLVEKVFVNGKASKWWMCFSKRKFMQKSMT